MESQQKEKKRSNKQRIFENDTSKNLFNKGIKYLAIAVPLLFISPIIITIGFKAINKDHNYLILVLGCILTICTVILVIQGIRIILKALFAK